MTKETIQDRAGKYEGWKRGELVETAEARGYGRVASLSRDRLVTLLAKDDCGIVTEGNW